MTLPPLAARLAALLSPVITASAAAVTQAPKEPIPVGGIPILIVDRTTNGAQV